MLSEKSAQKVSLALEINVHVLPVDVPSHVRLAASTSHLLMPTVDLYTLVLYYSNIMLSDLSLLFQNP